MASCMHYYILLPGTYCYLEQSGNAKWLISYTDWRKALPANFFHLPQQELGKKAVTKHAFHVGKMIF